MLYLTSKLKTYNINAIDGEMGKIKDLYFDDKKWAIRYAIVDTRKWLPGRRVLLSPTSFVTLNENDENLEVKFTKEAIRNSPSIPEEKAISKDIENSLVGYYGWSRYWMGNMLWGPEDRPLTHFGSDTGGEDPLLYDQQLETQQEYDLRSEEETIDFKVHADDGKIGKVADMIYDSEYWKIRYIIVQYSESIVEEEYIIYTPDDIESVDWYEKDIYVTDLMEAVKHRKLYKTKEEVIASL
ncbi:PRC-barrel domain-containing protein [Virgibacillus sp. C22-A2]|uniref:PRC-barrel domain-containing protein n=1 Tax=Virgibacillus tibetensis TaxID=3042313 RepID=A0ABU6KF24_9BACI|nr:PRC-barrel domain-containing protein [Virgibacillus sp. C22-A2]